MLGCRCFPANVAAWFGLRWYCWSCHRAVESEVAPKECDYCGCRDIRPVPGTESRKQQGG